MSDLSQPLSLVPLDAAADGTAAAGATSRASPGAGQPFAWPTPPLPSYPAPVVLGQPEPCEIDSGSGQPVRASLLQLDPGQLAAQVQLPTGRGVVTLRFSQFARLTLLRPLAALPALAGDAAALAARPVVAVTVTLRRGAPLRVSSVGHLETEAGLFLFEPVDSQGAVRRLFVPRSAYAAVALGGERIGEVLVHDSAATPRDVAQGLADQEALRSRRLGEVLLMQQAVTPEQLLAAVEQQARMPLVRIGEALLALGYVNQAQLDEALEQQKTDRSLPLGELLVKKGVVSRTDLQAALSRKMGYPIVDVAQFPVETEALHRLPHAVASRLRALPLLLRGGRLIVAMEDPSAKAVRGELHFATEGKVVPVMGIAGALREAIDRAYQRIGSGDGPAAPRAEAFVQGDGGWADALPTSDVAAAHSRELVSSLEQQLSAEAASRSDEDERPIEQSDNSLVKLINQMIVEAHAQGVSDIHVESQPAPEKLRIRFRKDGRLQPYLELPHTYRNALIGRLKVMCDLDISERRKPQDGKIAFARFVPGMKLELRVATIPTHQNLEDAVLRLLSSARPIPLPELGLAPPNLAALTQLLERPHGLLLCVGPTGSGKTTTLHSALAHLNRPDRKIWTAEDPIEITQAGLRQVQVNAKIDWTFARALRAFLRADPDVIMVGEVRDGETAQMAIEASLTGHLVLSTLHTNSAVETVTRLLDMGMDPFNFADSLAGVVAQRLVRRLCTHCRVERPLTDAELDECVADWLHAMDGCEAAPTRGALVEGWLGRFGRDGRLRQFTAPGCRQCDGTGLRGRVALQELMVVSREMRALIQTGRRADELLALAQRQGLRTLRQDGIEKVLAGSTTLDEVRSASG